MRRKMTSIMLCILMVAMAFFVTQTSGMADEVKKVKQIPVPWQEWRIVYDPSGQIVIGVDDIIFFDPPQMPEDAVAIVRWYVVLPYQISLDELTWEETEILSWVLVDSVPYKLLLNEEVHLIIPIEETDEAVLVRYTVAWWSTPDVIESRFVNEALLESNSPQAIVGSLSNFDVHNDYDEPIDNFELELYGNLVPADVLDWYDPPGSPYKVWTPSGYIWYGGWGAPPEINAITGGIEIVWKDEDNPIPYCEWIHFGVSLRLQKKVKVIPAPVQFWREFLGGVTDIIINDPPEVTQGVAIVRDYVVLPYQIPLELLTWEGTQYLDWIPIDDPANPYILQPGEIVEYDIPTTEKDQAALVRYTVAWESTPEIIECRFVNEATLESQSPQVITGQLSNFDVHNDYHEAVDNFELELYGIQPWDIVGWFPGWGTPPRITWLPDGSGTEVLWMDPDNPIPPCQWVHFGLYVIPGVIGWGAKAYWTQLLDLTGAKAYLTQIVKAEKVKVIPVPWQFWVVQDNTVTDIIFFDPPEMPENAVVIVRWYVVLDYDIPLNELTWEETKDLPWELIDYVPEILYEGEQIAFTIDITEDDRAVLVRYTVAWVSTSNVIECRFVNEAVLESHSPQGLVGWLSNFDVHNDYPDPIDNFELELYGNIVPGDVWNWYDPPGPPYKVLTPNGFTWYGGWGAPPIISSISGGIELEWIQPDIPVKFCEWIHFGVDLNPSASLWGAKAFLTQLDPEADIDIDPDTLNLKGEGEWVTCYIELYNGYDVNDIDVSTVKISDINGETMEIFAESEPTEVGDYDDDGIPDLMVKFDRAELQKYVSPGDATITVEGKLTFGTVFSGEDIIKVIDEP